jgi:hypothetical protein
VAQACIARLSEGDALRHRIDTAVKTLGVQFRNPSDVAMFIGWIGFFVSLIPTVVGVNKPAWSTALSTSVLNVIVLWATWRKRLYVPLIANTFTTATWWVITYQAVQAQLFG